MRVPEAVWTVILLWFNGNGYFVVRLASFLSEDYWPWAETINVVGLGSWPA